MIQTYLKQLIRYGEEYLMLPPRDRDYCFNRLLFLLGLDDCGPDAPIPSVEGMTGPDEVLSPILQYALEQGIIREEQIEAFSARLMDTVSLRPSEIQRIFDEKKAESSKAATDWFHDYCEKNDYVKRSAIARNLRWDAVGEKASLIITVNLSKPEIDNKKSAAALKQKSSSYPSCAICRQNEGFSGHGTVRDTLRTIDVTLDGQPCFWQYSPYAYFKQHAIIINTEHTPMVVNAQALRRLVDFVDQYPHYFIGSNAALPRIGGSLLVHDHYQGGSERMPMHDAKARTVLSDADFPVKVSILEWFNSTVRLESSDRNAIVSVACKLIEAWRNYTNTVLEIWSESEGEHHNSCSPVVRKTKDGYVIDLILRNNRVSEQYPDGIFHAHPEYHNIKKESIGLIEAMGLFILPARLNRQLFSEIVPYLCGKEYRPEALAEDMQVHTDMISLLLSRYGNRLSEADAREAVRQRVNEVCFEILRNTAVFPETPVGAAAFEAFVRENV
ncbi:MAG: UDP-glucose--hexose-1-phosphate uridylyltransferase [Clostridia bacterium]|nr:UDP-glucose--hexose-1-phosphate uridylyltransferase [Clostridia bacterium]